MPHSYKSRQEPSFGANEKALRAERMHLQCHCGQSECRVCLYGVKWICLTVQPFHVSAQPLSSSEESQLKCPSIYSKHCSSAGTGNES